MNKAIIEHLFTFWSEIGRLGGFLYSEEGIQHTLAPEKSWPSKVFGLRPSRIDENQLLENIRVGAWPNSVGIYEDIESKTLLVNNGFKLGSTVKAMALKVSNGFDQIVDLGTIALVKSDEEVQAFVKIASMAFGYPVLTKTLSPLLKASSFQLFLGMHGDDYASCGMVFTDQDGISGIHMIGTLPEFQGLGLGKKMTQYLVKNAKEKGSTYVYLVASQAGEGIYAKMGFKTYGVLKSYQLPDGLEHQHSRGS